MLLANALAGVLLAAACRAHMMLDYPAAFNASNNPHRKTAADPYLEFPYDKAGPNARWMYPCRGYEKLIGTPEGAPIATWEAGTQQNWNISGIGNHFGGSCQVGFSTDGGKNFHVATSYMGNCPHRNNGNGPDGQNFEFMVPGDIQEGVQLFSWVWHNREQELNMNCAAIEITRPTTQQAAVSLTAGSPTTLTIVTTQAAIVPSATDAQIQPSSYGSKDRDFAEGVAFYTRPLMFVADDGNDCLTPHTTAELRYPEPGPDVVLGDGAYPLELPIGKCGQEQMLAKQAFTGDRAAAY
ncbi:hypothetical protein DOTSEDRAFT_79599 [Dothistroma septosporum NZE10]|uniref:Lytic polysaccharide monooxygenase n=1 Tax=Dothistroma septosporum (strain NZE10 / CBS 128990) TaxID=675120 RepID=N1PQG8_DOTSN|nr:hypothetical protein DOTSEDRAFT_79599 [Dothistroma septosporum NZE10]